MVVQVSADGAGRHQRSRQLEPFAARGLPRQHVHLNPARDLQLALEPFLRRGRLLQLLDVLLERIAHVMERSREPAGLVLRTDGRQLEIEIACRDLLGALRQSFERPRQPAREQDDDEGERGEAGGDEACLYGAQRSNVREELVLRIQHGNRPAREANRSERHPIRAAIQIDRLEAGSAAKESKDDPPFSRLRLRRELFWKPRAADPFRGRMAEDAPLARHDHAEPAPSRLNRPRQAIEPREIEVGRDDGVENGRTVLVMSHRNGVRHHEDVSAALIEIGLRPARLTGFRGHRVPLRVPSSGSPARRGRAARHSTIRSTAGEGTATAGRPGGSL